MRRALFARIFIYVFATHIIAAFMIFVLTRR